MTTVQIVPLVLRVLVGLTMMAHGYNHLFGPGGISGTAGWFSSMGLRPAKVHATLSGWGELAAGLGLVVGLFTSFAGAFVVGTMVVAGVVAHRKNGFFVFKEGFEYVLVLAVVVSCIALLGPGSASLDHLIGLDTALDGVVGVLITAGGGVFGAALLLAATWRPNKADG